MRRLVQALQFLVALAILVALVGGAGWIIYAGITEAPAVVAAIVTGFGALFGLFFQRYLEWQREDARQRRERMTPIYEQLVKTFYESADGNVSEDEQQRFFEQLAQRLLLWGSPEILKAFGVWKKQAAAADPSSEADAASNLLVFEQLLFAMRKDIGQANDNLAAGDLLRIVVNDFDEHLGAGT